MRTRIVFAALLALAVAPLARADGLPLSDAGAPATIAGPGAFRYVALPGRHDTMVARLDEVVYASRSLPGRFTVPVVALDGTSSGLSKDGSTLVLINPRRSFPRAKTTFAVLDARSLRLRSTVVLEGDYSFDALSPDGARLYLVHYESRRDPTQYEVVVYDLAAYRLLPDPIVDPAEVDEQMRGYPLTRVTSADGRYAYTLYDGAGKTPFVHALDTTKGEARCIDLDSLAGRQDLYELRLDLGRGGTQLAVVKGTSEVTRVDTRTYLPAAGNAPVRNDSSSTAPIVAFSALGAAVVGVLLLLLRRRTRARAYEASAGPT